MAMIDWRPQSATHGVWWSGKFTLPRTKLADLEDLSEVPGVSVSISDTEDRMVIGAIQAHRSAHAALARLGFSPPGAMAPADLTGDTLSLPTRSLRSYQIEGALTIVGAGGGLLCDAPGLGKTSSSIAAAVALCNDIGGRTSVLVVGPKYVRNVWRQELLACGVIDDPDDFYAVDARTPTKEAEQAFGAARWRFCHYDLLDDWRHVFTNPLYGTRANVVIFDEAHWLRNPKAKRTKAALAIGPLARHRIVLTGTPLANRVRDLWPLLTLAGGGGSWGTLFQFLSRYTHYARDAYGWVSYGTRHEEELRQRLAGLYVRRTNDDVGAEIPPLTRIVHRIPPERPLSAPLQRFTGGDTVKALQRLRDAFRSGVAREETLKLINDWRKWTSDAKVDYTAHSVASILEQNENAVVFTWRRETAESIAKQVDKLSEFGRAFVIHGGVPDAERVRLIDEFQANHSPTVIVATIDSLKEGVTLHAASDVFLHDLDWIPATVLQAEKRIHRIGARKPCRSHWIVIESSADELIVEHLDTKAEVIADALDDAAMRDALDETQLRARDAGADFASEILGDDA